MKADGKVKIKERFKRGLQTQNFNFVLRQNSFFNLTNNGAI